MKILDPFPLPLKTTFVGPGIVQLQEPFEYRSKKYGIIRVPKDFISDGASIPQWAYSIVGGRFTGKYLKPAIIHDWLYHMLAYKRMKCDKIFLVGMKDAKEVFWKRRVIHLGVRVGGWKAWADHKRRIKAL